MVSPDDEQTPAHYILCRLIIFMLEQLGEPAPEDSEPVDLNALTDRFKALCADKRAAETRAATIESTFTQLIEARDAALDREKALLAANRHLAKRVDEGRLRIEYLEDNARGL